MGSYFTNLIHHSSVIQVSSSPYFLQVSKMSCNPLKQTRTIRASSSFHNPQFPPPHRVESRLHVRQVHLRATQTLRRLLHKNTISIRLKSQSSITDGYCTLPPIRLPYLELLLTLHHLLLARVHHQQRANLRDSNSYFWDAQ